MLLCRTLDVTLELKDPHYPEQYLGSLELSVTLSPKEGDVRDAVRNPINFFTIYVGLHHIPLLSILLTRMHISVDISHQND